MNNLKFPDYQQIKKLPLFHEDDEMLDEDERTPYEYTFNIFTIYKDIYCRIKYNEEGTKIFFLDIMCDGYCDKYYDSNTKFDATEEGYKVMCGKIKSIYNGVLHNLNNSNTVYADDWFK